MACFDIERLPNDISSARAWAAISGAIRTGYVSVEVVERRVGGEQVWELRKWNGFRHDGSNKKTFSPEGCPPHCPECPEAATE